MPVRSLLFVVVLLADELTGALDSRTTQEVLEIFTKLNASGKLLRSLIV